MSNKNVVTTTGDLNSKELELLKQTYAKELSPPELGLFLAQSKAMGLNPFTKEIYAIKFVGRMTLMTSVGGLRKIAHRSNTYLGCKVTITYEGSTKKPFSATAIAKKLVGNRVAEFEATVMFDEYNSGKDNWLKIPVSMISKVAESAVLRMAFPNIDLLHDAAEEMGVQHTQEIEFDAVQETEHETQEIEHPPAERVIVNHADNIYGDKVIKLASKNYASVKIKDIPKKELSEFLVWAYKQEKLNPVTKEAVSNVEAFLGPNANN